MHGQKNNQGPKHYRAENIAGVILNIMKANANKYLSQPWKISLIS